METLCLSMNLVICTWILLQISKTAVDSSNPNQCEKKSEKLKFVTVHVDGRTEDGQQIESTYVRGIPMEFQLGVGMVFVGLDEGLHGMCIGDKKRLIIPPNKAYKKRGKQKPELPKSTTLIYDVELINVSDYATINAFRWLDSNEDKKLSKIEALELIEMTFEPSAQFPSIDANRMLDMYMNMHDTNKDGVICEKEFTESSNKAHKMQKEYANQGTMKATKNSKKEQAATYNSVKEEL